MLPYIWCVQRDFIVAWTRDLRVPEERCVKFMKCLEIEYLLSLPRNFKEYKQRTFSNEAHACHFLVLQRCYGTKVARGETQISYYHYKFHQIGGLA